MNIALDIGNTRVKVGYFSGRQLLAVSACFHQEFPDAVLASEDWRRYSSRAQYLGQASVGNKSLAIGTRKLIAAQPRLRLLEIDHHTPLPIGNSYASQETLGIDRLCSAVGAYSKSGSGPLLVVDAGTAITFDFVDESGNYLGGGISPGISMRFRALQEHTAMLPLVEKALPAPLIGNDTVSSIRSGVINGVLCEIEGIVRRYQDKAGDDLKVFLTGGDAQFLGNHLKYITFVDANLLLDGINAIILQHA